MIRQKVFNQLKIYGETPNKRSFYQLLLEYKPLSGVNVDLLKGLEKMHPQSEYVKHARRVTDIGIHQKDIGKELLSCMTVSWTMGEETVKFIKGPEDVVAFLDVKDELERICLANEEVMASQEYDDFFRRFNTLGFVIKR